MTASNLYQERTMQETFGKSKCFETARRLREVWEGFPKYSDTANEFTAAWLVFVMSKTGTTTTKRAVNNAIISGNNLKSGDESFIIWLGNLLVNPEEIRKQNISIWVFESADFVEVRHNNHIKIFQGKEKVKSVSRATNLSSAFLYDLAMVLSKSLIDESLKSEIIFEYNGNEDDE